jgi:hypothetical protein
MPDPLPLARVSAIVVEIYNINRAERSEGGHNGKQLSANLYLEKWDEMRFEVVETMGSL